MTGHEDDLAGAAWSDALAEGDVEAWMEHLDRVEVADHFQFLQHQGATRWDGIQLSLHQWINDSSKFSADALLHRIRGSNSPVEERLAAATIARWRAAVERLLLDSHDATLPSRGIVQYFSDRLAVSVIMEFRRTGSTVELLGTFAFPNPLAFLDPLEALKYVEDSAQLSLLRASLYSRHKNVIHRNVLIHIDREVSGDVFGPSIDTLFLNDWLFENRYSRQRIPENMMHFEEAMTKSATLASQQAGTRFLEIGCGNGLLTATFAKNEAKIHAFAALDVSMSAVSVTHLNSARQRLLHRGVIGDRGLYITADYDPQILPQHNDLVVCNPPYVPFPQPYEQPNSRIGRRATLGTDLLSRVVRDAPTLVSPAQGELVMVISELAEPELIESIPAGWTFTKESRCRVPFRLDSIDLHKDGDFLRWLCDERGLERADAGELEGYLHWIAIFRIVQEGTS